MTGALLLAAAIAALPLLTGNRLYDMGLFSDAATEYLRELHSGTPDTGAVRISLGFSFAAAGETERAAAELRAVVGPGR